MGITLDQLVFDTANPDDGANVGAYVRAGDDGTAIGHTGDALKVDIGAVADLDIRDLDASQDNVAISDGTDTMAVNADGSINSVVSATDLDVRDLSASQDNVAISDGTDTLAVNGDGSLNAVVSATDLDIRDLSDATDSVSIGDGTDTLEVNTDGSINVKFGAPQGPQTSIATVGVAASELAAVPLTDRTRVLIQNNGSKSIYIGEANTVTTANGICIPRGASMELPYGESANMWAISSAAGQDVRILELN